MNAFIVKKHFLKLFFSKIKMPYFKLHKSKIIFLYVQFMFCLRKLTNTCYFQVSIKPRISGTIPNLDISGLDNSAIKFQCALLLKFEPHYDLQTSVHFVSEVWVSLKLMIKCAKLLTGIYSKKLPSPL
ncbi:MAG: hypothetical protein CVU52_10260 [Deltaproteobacteria bacterium HGW-Deltaproteobacteria-10]|nr:MAG: hypothetical protein CVU62_06060 [Deltaproteobacteria bacterium HGW-Deltaproteobacteria-2]PKN68239.1 MAG: hypothetical protein CVU52_10260 [Deltaproteobacteria bacterium HGW-Deltaproteobacteria-10]